MKRSAPPEGAAAPNLKRRKASTASHPLRQTSFPPDNDARSPSIESMSQVSAAKKKRGRKSKAEKAREQTPTTGRAVSTARSTTGAPAAGDEEGMEGDDGPTEVAAMEDRQTEEQKMEEHRLKSMLIGSFSPEQFSRYENWRAAALKVGSVRKLVNATVSQSVAENSVLGMKAITKLFLGDIIEEARRVQAEWIAKTGEKQTDLRTPSGPDSTTPVDEAEAMAREFDRAGRPGPLLPEHLREAVRRYKLANEGYGVGMSQAWTRQQRNGIERFPVRTGGRRIFK